MKQFLVVALIFVFSACTPQNAEVAEWESRAEGVTIVRDDWGVPHIHGATDADAVFGLMYAQAEDDFNRIEVNFINAMGRLSEAEGRGELYRDLRMKLFIDPVDLQALYGESPEWLRALMDAWADGLNYYLYKNPDVTPRVIDRFEPWMALSFSEGSIGGDIERVNIRRLEEFYRGPRAAMPAQPGALRPAASRAAGPGDRLAASSEDRWSPESPETRFPDEAAYEEPSGSNGFAIAPSNSATGNALLWINPHTSFFFRAEVQVTSDEGLNAYGAVTWGQFFVYQGFNESAGWMHTSSSVDNIDEFAETVIEQDGALYYLYGEEQRPVLSEPVTVAFRTDAGLADTTFTVYRTHHGPVVRALDGQWVTVSLMDDPMNALIQSYERTKAGGYDEYLATMRRHTNSSNNTVFADREGNIAYLHSNFIPRRDPRFDFRTPVDGSDPATDWNGVLTFEESPNVVNPPNGWLQNTNNWPYSAAGANSPRRENYAAYVDAGSENARGINALRVLGGVTDFTMESLTRAAFDPWLSAFAESIPGLVAAFDRRPASDVAEQIERLRAWDYSWGLASVETSLAVYWAEQLMGQVSGDARAAGVSWSRYVADGRANAEAIDALRAATEKLEADFGDWRTPWGDINRFQRLTGDIVQPFSDDGASIPVGFTSSRWGSLASFGARTYPGTVRRYGTSGNSFVAVVEFGDSLRAHAVTAGGLNSKPDSPHFNDQADRYASGSLREVYFYPSQLRGHVERTYHPGE